MFCYLEKIKLCKPFPKGNSWGERGGVGGGGKNIEETTRERKCNKKVFFSTFLIPPAPKSDGNNSKIDKSPAPKGINGYLNLRFERILVLLGKRQRKHDSTKKMQTEKFREIKFIPRRRIVVAAPRYKKGRFFGRT